MSLPPYDAHGRTVRMRPLPVLLPDGRTKLETMDAAVTQLGDGIDVALNLADQAGSDTTAAGAATPARAGSAQ